MAVISNLTEESCRKSETGKVMACCPKKSEPGTQALFEVIHVRLLLRWRWCAVAPPCDDQHMVTELVKFAFEEVTLVI